MKRFSYGYMISAFFLVFSLTAAGISAETAEDACIKCHQKVSPGQVDDWQASKHSGEDVGCVTCHGEKHTAPQDYKLAVLPDEKLCAECHEDQFNQFVKGKHNLG